MPGHAENVYSLINKFKSISSKKEKLLYICSVVQGFRGHGDHVNPAHADEFLNAVLPFTELNLDFANSHDEWVAALVGIIADHSASRHVDNVKEFSYCYHDSYEKAIFVVLSMVETTQLLKTFVGALEKLRLADLLVESLSMILVKDISYATQEIALDILCRMAMFYAQSPKSNDGIRFMDKLITSMPESMQRALKDPKIGPIGILVNMRPSLNEINSGNENVKSFPITAFGIEVARSVPYKRKIASATWLDLSREIFTLYIPEKDVMIKISYHLIARVHFATASNTVQIGLEHTPDSMMGLVQVEEQVPRGKLMFFFIEFGEGNNQAMEGVRETFFLRLKNAETLVQTDSLEKRRKYSIISSRDQTPEGLKIGLRRDSIYPSGGVILLDRQEMNAIVPHVETKARERSGSVMEDLPKAWSGISNAEEQRKDEGSTTKVSAVVTISKVGKFAKKVAEYMGEEFSVDFGYEDTLTAISSPDRETDFHEEKDRGYLRHQVVTKKPAPATTKLPVAAAVLQSAVVPTKAKGRKKKSIPSILTAYDQGISLSPAVDVDSALVRDEKYNKNNMDTTTRALFKRKTKTKMESKEIQQPCFPIQRSTQNKNNKAVEIYVDKGKDRGGISPVPEASIPDDKITKQPNRVSKTVTALQDVSNVFTPMTSTLHTTKRTYAGRGNSIKSLKSEADTYSNLKSARNVPNDENADPKECSSQSTPLQNSRRRSYKMRSSSSAAVPPPSQISVLSMTRAVRRDSLLDISTSVGATVNDLKAPKKDIASKCSGIDTIREISKEEKLEKSNLTTLVGVVAISTTKKTNVKARMRATAPNNISEEDEEPQESRIIQQRGKVESTKSQKPEMAIILSKVKEANMGDEINPSPILSIDIDEAGQANSMDIDFNDADDEVSSSDNDHNRIGIVMEGEVISDPLLPPHKTGSQNADVAVTNWRTSATPPVFSSPEASNSTMDSFHALEPDEAIKVIVRSTAQAARIKHDTYHENKSEIKGLKEKEKETVREKEGPKGRRHKSPLIMPLSPPSDNSRSQEDIGSSYLRPTDNNRESKQEDSSSEGEGPSSDEDGVIAMLLQELVTMQKARATRKRARLMASAAEAASVQVQYYLQQWSDFTDSSLLELHNAMTIKLEVLCATADTVCEALLKESYQFDEEAKKAQTIAVGIETEINSFRMEVSSAVTMQREEEATMKCTFSARSRSIVEGARKSIEHMKRDRDRGGLSNRKNTKQLMLALRDL